MLNEILQMLMPYLLTTLFQEWFAKNVAYVIYGI